MLENITLKLGMTIEEYASRLKEYLNRPGISENDNPIPGLVNLSVLTMEEAKFMANYVTQNGL